MIEKRPSRYTALCRAAGASIGVVLPSAFLSGLGTYAISAIFGVEAITPGLIAVLAGLGGLGPLLFLVPRDYMAYRDAETRSDREYREKAMLHKLAKRYPGEVNDL